MIRVSVLYPASSGSRFDVDYYVGTHMPLARGLLGAAVKEISVEIGLGGGRPGEPAPFAAIGGFIFESVEAFRAAFLPVADQLREDIPNYSDNVPILQISEIHPI